jgi:hypothetical protein
MKTAISFLWIVLISVPALGDPSHSGSVTAGASSGRPELSGPTCVGRCVTRDERDWNATILSAGSAADRRIAFSEAVSQCLIQYPPKPGRVTGLAYQELYSLELMSSLEGGEEERTEARRRFCKVRSSGTAAGPALASCKSLCFWKGKRVSVESKAVTSSSEMALSEIRYRCAKAFPAAPIKELHLAFEHFFSTSFYAEPGSADAVRPVSELDLHHFCPR